MEHLTPELAAAYFGGALCFLLGSVYALRWRNDRTALLCLIVAVLLLSVPYSTMSIEQHVISVTLPIRKTQ